MNLFNKHLALGLAISLVAVACAAPTIPNGTESGEEEEGESEVITKKPSSKKKPSAPKDDEGTADPENDPPASTPSTPDPGPGTPTTPAPNNCAAQQGDACFDCCDQVSGGELAQADDVFGQCACGGGQCTSVCGSFCNGGQPSQQCEQCLTQTCEPAADAQCTSSACQAGLACVQQCQ